MRISLLLFALVLIAGKCEKNPDPESGWKIGEPEISIKAEPLLVEREHNELVTLMISVDGQGKPLSLAGIEIGFAPESSIASLSSISALYTGVDSGIPQRVLIATVDNPSHYSRFQGNLSISAGKHWFVLDFRVKPGSDIAGKLRIETVTFSFSNGSTARFTADPADTVIRFGKIVRATGQDGSDTYRIPGLVTTNAGTLIAVYDNRYNNSKDLQEDIDIGMSRSTDSGRTWEPMKVIMDMGEYGGLPQNLNGIGDPSVLYDHFTNTIWVAALWMNGSAPDKMLWWASQPGITPQETGQFILVKSTDDGLSWSDPVNITKQIKNPAWQLLLQGPGRGITMSDGTLVFSAQFKADIGMKSLDGGQYTCHSTIVYSKDGGDTWIIGAGAKSNTTEAQVVELSDGSLMLNMRDDRNRSDKGATNGRAVAVTSDMGRTWVVHPSSNYALPEPNCMASLIAADLSVEGGMKKVLFFSNPNDKERRVQMTVKLSLDEGLTWPSANWIELFGPSGYGYSCLTMVDDNNVGILYEGVRELYFQKIPVSDLLKINKLP